jgi:hypothetical protein
MLPSMLVIASASASNVDVVARVIAIAGLGVATASLILTWYLWRRSGPALDARVDRYVGRSERSGFEKLVFTVDVTNVGRMPATVRSVSVAHLPTRWQFSWWLKWPLRLLKRNWVIATLADPLEGNFPQEIPPTGYLRVRAEIDADLFSPSDRWVQVIIERGDGKATFAKPVRAPGHERLPRELRNAQARRTAERRTRSGHFPGTSRRRLPGEDEDC